MHPDVETAQRLGDEIAGLSAHIEVATARLLELIREFDTFGGWGHAGAKSCAEWLSWRVGVDLRAAYERVRVARALPRLPLISAAFAGAEISYSKVRALIRVATPETEGRLLAFARHGTAAHVERLTRAWRRVDRNAEHQEAEQQHQSRTLSVYQDEDGMFVIRGRLTPEVGAVVRQALTAATDRLYADSRVKVPGQYIPTTNQHQADALGIIAEAALRHDLDPGTSGARYQVVVHVDAAVLGDPDQPGQSVLDETHCSAEQSRRIACDASRVVMNHDGEGRVTEIGARTRTIPPALRRALEHRDRGCRFPGCSSRFTQGHHIKHWANGGPTNGELQFRSPHGWVIDKAPPLPDAPGALENLNAGARLDAHRLTPDWDGTRLNLDHAIQVMHPLAWRARPPIDFN